MTVKFTAVVILWLQN